MARLVAQLVVEEPQHLVLDRRRVVAELEEQIAADPRAAELLQEGLGAVDRIGAERARGAVEERHAPRALPPREARRDPQ